MFNLENFILIFFSIYFILFGLVSIGVAYNNGNIEKKNYSQPLIVGYCLTIIFLNALYFLLNIKFFYLIIFLSLIFIVSFIVNLKRNKYDYFKYLVKIFTLTIAPFIFFGALYFFYGEQFYVFRGNKWDWFGLVSTSFYLTTIDTNDFLNLANNFNKENFDNLRIVSKELSPYHFNVINWLDKIPTLSLLFGMFIKINLSEPFLMAFFFKCLCFMILNVSIFDFISRLNFEKKFIKNYFFTIVFCFSFWSIYILEADYARLLSGFPIFVFLLFNLKNIFKDFNEKNYLEISIYIFCVTTLFLIYPEILFIYFCLLLVVLFFDKIFLNFFKKNYLNISVSIILVFILAIPTINLNFDFFIHQIQSAKFENRWWAYFGAFIFGSENPALNTEFSNYVKELIYASPSAANHDNLSLKEIIFIIHHSIVKFNYESIYVNVIPSLFGYYFVTNIDFLKNIFYLNYFLLILFSIYLLIHFFKNCWVLFNNSNSFVDHIKFSLIVFIILSFFFILKGKLWTEIKLYIYFFPIFASLILFTFKKKNKLKIYPNYFLIIIMIMFPIYKFTTFNSGIGKFDSFPSIQNKNMKIKINWDFNYKKYKKCKKINLGFVKFDYFNPSTISDHFKSNYLTIYLVSEGYQFVDYNKLKYIKNKKIIKEKCDVSSF